jgi:hypothetical protein
MASDYLFGLVLCVAFGLRGIWSPAWNKLPLATRLDCISVLVQIDREKSWN